MSKILKDEKQPEEADGCIAEQLVFLSRSWFKSTP